MCWMTIYRGPDAVAHALDAVREHEQFSGGHSWGVAFALDGEIHVEKGIGAVPPGAVDAYPEATVALAHTRFATRGRICDENAHPFSVRDDDGDVIAVLAHNGTWLGAPTTERADSYYIARLLETLYRADPDRPFAELVQRTGEVTGQTIVVLHRDGGAYAYAGRFPITTLDAAWVASSGGTPIPEGEVRTI